LLKEDEEQTQGDGGNSVRLLRIFQNFPLVLLSRFCRVLARSSKSTGSSVFRALNTFLLRKGAKKEVFDK
jgi:hypothetical protein